MAPPTPGVLLNDPREPLNVVKYVRPLPKEPETDILNFICMPLMLAGVLLQTVSLFYVCLLLLIANWLSCNYGEFNIQQYSSMGMLCFMGLLMPMLQQQQHPKLNSSSAAVKQPAAAATTPPR